MKTQPDYIQQEEYSAIMNYDPYKERADELSNELFRLKMKYEDMERSRDRWKKLALDHENKMQSHLEYLLSHR